MSEQEVESGTAEPDINAGQTEALEEDEDLEDLPDEEDEIPAELVEEDENQDSKVEDETIYITDETIPDDVEQPEDYDDGSA